MSRQCLEWPNQSQSTPKNYQPVAQRVLWDSFYLKEQPTLEKFSLQERLYPKTSILKTEWFDVQGLN